MMVPLEARCELRKPLLTHLCLWWQSKASAHEICENELCYHFVEIRRRFGKVGEVHVRFVFVII